MFRKLLHLFAPTRHPPTLGEAEAMLEEVSQLLMQAPPAAMIQLGKQGRRFSGFFGVGKPLHDRFNDLAWQVCERVEPDCHRHELPALREVSWDTWPDPTMGDLVDLAEQTSESLLYLIDARDRSYIGPLDEFYARRRFAEQDDLALIMIASESTWMVKTAFVQAARDRLVMSSEDIASDFQDLAQQLQQRIEGI